MDFESSGETQSTPYTYALGAHPDLDLSTVALVYLHFGTFESATTKATMVERLTIGDYSMKNIPIPSRFEYYKNLVHKIENFNRRIRWKAFFILNPSDKTNKEKETFGFKSSYSPPHVKELEMFEKDLYNLISSIEFRQHSSHFQKKLKNDITKISKIKGIVIPADKTRNYYKMDQDKYKKLLLENVTMDYEKATDDNVKNVNHGAANIARKLELQDRMICYTKPDSYSL